MWTSKRNSPANISHYDSSNSLTDGYKYMFQKLVEKAAALNDMIEDIGTFWHLDLCLKNQLLN